MRRLNPAYQKIILTLKKYSYDNKITIETARLTIATVHRIPRPYNTKILNDLSKQKVIKFNGSRGLVEILV